MNLWLLKSFVIVKTCHQLFWMIFSGKRVKAGITWDKFLNFQDRYLNQYTTEEKVFHFENRKYGTYCQMIENTLIIYILLRIKLRDRKMKIVLASSVKLTLTKEKKSLGYSSNFFGTMAVAYQYRFATNTCKLLLVYLFNRLFLGFWWILWILSFLYLFRNQSVNVLITISWLVSVWEVRVMRVWDSMGTLAIYGLPKCQ